MFKKPLALIGTLLCTIVMATAQYNINVTIADATIISYVTGQGKPVFTISGINNIINQYTVTGFEKAFPSSRFAHKQRVYKMTVSSLSLPIALTTSYPSYFLHYESIAVGEVLSYTPNDYTTTWPTRYTEYLDYINARDAWGVTKGDPNIVVGVTDTYIETTHPDLAGKIAQIGYNDYNYYPADPKHGTQISGLIATATDNNLYYPSIGFNCRVDFISSLNTSDMLTLSKRNRKVLNASWRNSSPTPILTLSGNEQETYQEIYENGTLACIAAGNGHGSPWQYVYPSSYDYVFSTTGIRYGNPTAGWHDDGTDTMNTHQHNPRVDIAAPGIAVGGITYDLQIQQVSGNGIHGTAVGALLALVRLPQAQQH